MKLLVLPGRTPGAGRYPLMLLVEVAGDSVADIDAADGQTTALLAHHGRRGTGCETQRAHV